jgi:hypothetical protein
MIVVPDRFKNDADGPCHTPTLRKQFWTDVLTSLELSYDTLFEAARQQNVAIAASQQPTAVGDAGMPQEGFQDCAPEGLAINALCLSIRCLRTTP